MRYGFLFFWLILWALPGWAGEAHAAVHLQSAQVLQTRVATDEPPPRVVRSDQLPGSWQSVTLPHAERHDILAQASGALAPRLDGVVTWYRLEVPPQAWGAQPLML